MKKGLGTRLHRLWITLFVLLAVAVGAPAAYAETAAQNDEVRQLLEQYHLSKPDDSELKDKPIPDMVNALHDPWTEYFSPEDWSKFNDALEQTFVGIGIVMSEDEGRIYVAQVLPGSPAERAGLKEGDQLVGAGAVSLKGKKISDVQSQLLGEPGTTLTLSVDRSGQTLKFKIVRESIQYPAATGRMMGDGVGYLQLSGFTSDAAAKFRQQLAQLEQSGMTSLIIDLRDNGGGYVDQAKEIASLFIRDGVLAHMKDRDGVDHPIAIQGSEKPYPIRVLVNGYTASAAELLSGALQDYKAAVLIGTQTYGKGVVQSLIPLSSGGVLKVTVEEYFTPNGRKVNQVGLTPDIRIAGAAEQLIAAYRGAGGRRLELTSGKGVVTVNGVHSAESSVAFQHSGVWYVQARIAAAVAGASVRYDAGRKAVVLSRDGTEHAVAAGDSRLKLLDGANYIDARLLTAWFPDVTCTAAGGKLTLRTE